MLEEYYVVNKFLGGIENIVSLLEQILMENKHMSAELDALTLQVAETVGVEQSVVTLLQGVQARLDALAAQLAAAGIDNSAVVALSNDLHTNTDALAAAAANFPSA